MTEWIGYVGAFTGALLLSFLLVPVMIRLAFRFDILDHPGFHKTHKNVHPLLGGGAIFLAFMTVIFAGFAMIALAKTGQLSFFPTYQRHLQSQLRVIANVLPEFIALIVSATIIFILGLVDDIRGVGFSYKWKFAVQAIAAAIVVSSGIRIEFLPHPILNILVTMLWIIGITNSFNLLDNMDGLSSGVAAIISLILAALTIRQGQYFSALLFLTLAGSILGFVRYNFNPSKIFMGDAGSLFIGFMIATLTVSNSYVTTHSVSQLPVVVPLLVLGVPLFDTFSVMIIRWKEKRPLFVGDTCHFSHRLVKMGMSVRQTVIFIYLATLCVGVSAILIPDLNLAECMIVLVQEFLVFGLITLLMIKGNHLHLLHQSLKADLEQLRAASGHGNNGHGHAK
ncbi:glycosyl transferase family 4 [Candidatus Moduliflexus flocculans]|uniref:Glycosyl transferase family 4 n=1 Tax=Candidatus Moduliflexus flocculans TaxID=1499966 RepID=A0A081BS91_9BACT|nr:glycosyl transferase family 4 [Candidatus Moduliflexus flocculans]